MNHACHTENSAMSTTNARLTRSSVTSRRRYSARAARSPPAAGSSNSAQYTDRTPTPRPTTPNALDRSPFSPRATSAIPAAVPSALASRHAAGAGAAARAPKYGSINALVRNIATDHALTVGRSRPLRVISISGSSMKMNASAKLNTPRVTGCTAGAGPRTSIPNLSSAGRTKKKSVDSATTSASVVGATAHAGSPGRPCHPGGERRSTNQYAAPSA
mmetsp:Transcript_3306/g.13432  ORF Transcript_3306/g.13432 Transcript_3306/m.13432 type:complete len:217 (-) Transcript_3306:828-1478(-)